MQIYQSTPDFYNDYIAHFNKNHDPKNGQFTTGSGSGSGSVSSKTGKNKNLIDKSVPIPVPPEVYLATLGYRAARAAVSGIKTKSINSRLSKMPKDPKTGLSLKQKEYTDKQDLSLVNPGRGTFNEGYHSNCASCTMTYELRRRGYDVTANKNANGVTHSDYKKYFDVKPSKTVGDRKSSGGTGALMKWQNESRKEHKEYAASVIKDLNKLPKGTRGNLSVRWGAGGGHSMFFEISNSGLVVKDAQINKVYNNDNQLTKLFSNIVETSYFRLDNAKLKPKYIREVCH